MAHITGGGFVDNIPRVLPDGVGVHIDKNAWTVPPLFRLIQDKGGVSEAEMFRVFNMGVGYVLIVSPDAADTVTARLTQFGERVYRLGEAEAGQGVTFMSSQG